MEEYWNPEDPSVNEQAAEPEEETMLFDDLEQNVPAEPPKPKKKKKKMTFKRRVKRALRRFFKLPLTTRIIAGVLALVVLVVIIVLIVVLPKNCKASNDPQAALPSASATATAEVSRVETPDPSDPTPPPYTSAPTASPVPTLTQTIKPNERDAIVPYIRSRLVELGYMEMPQTNDELYDTATINAVRRFQYRNFPENNKEWDGYVGQKTFDKMFADDVLPFFMKSGDTDKKLYDGELVTKMQKMLVALNYLKTANGSYDAATRTAVSSFQKDNSLQADAVAGQSTLKLLAEKAAEALAAPAATDEAPVIVDATATPEA